jgi:hypothetical protein
MLMLATAIMGYTLAFTNALVKANLFTEFPPGGEIQRLTPPMKE